VGAVELGDGLLEDHELAHARIEWQGVEEAPETSLLHWLPREAETDVDRLHDAALLAQVGDQDRAVEAAAS